MSADNFNYIKLNRDGRWDVWLGLSASDDTHRQILRDKPHRTFDDRNEARDWAEEQGYTEYGTEIVGNDPPGAPGFYWAFLQGEWIVMQHQFEGMWYMAGSDEYQSTEQWGIEMWEGPIPPPPSNDVAKERRSKMMQSFRSALDPTTRR